MTVLKAYVVTCHPLVSCFYTVNNKSQTSIAPFWMTTLAVSISVYSECDLKVAYNLTIWKSKFISDIEALSKILYIKGKN